MSALTAHGMACEELHISTKGDLVQDRSLTSIGTDNIFIKELEAALRDGRADLAVHSCKDLASSLPSDMQLAAITARADPRDAFCSQRYPSLADLPAQAIVGTSSPRRRALLEELRPDLQYEIIRGNVDTRLRKLSEGRYDAIVLAMAGLIRLGLASKYIVPFDPVAFVPAVGQGALAIECRAGDGQLALRLSELLGDVSSTLAVEAERAYLRELHAGCQAPIGAHATIDGSILTLEAALEADGGGIVRGRSQQDVTSREEAQAVGVALARQMDPLRKSAGGAIANAAL